MEHESYLHWCLQSKIMSWHLCSKHFYQLFSPICLALKFIFAKYLCRYLFRPAIHRIPCSISLSMLDIIDSSYFLWYPFVFLIYITLLASRSSLWYRYWSVIILLWTDYWDLSYKYFCLFIISFNSPLKVLYSGHLLEIS